MSGTVTSTSSAGCIMLSRILQLSVRACDDVHVCVCDARHCDVEIAHIIIIHGQLTFFVLSIIIHNPLNIPTPYNARA